MLVRTQIIGKILQIEGVGVLLQERSPIPSTCGR